MDRGLGIVWKARRIRKAGGGAVTGPLHSHVAGRTDHLAIDVPAGAYVIPADIVSALGEGNTQAGLKVLDSMFPKKRASGGEAIPIMAAGGEYVISPEAVAALGEGDMDRGHAALDEWVMSERQKLIRTLGKLPGPARD